MAAASPDGRTVAGTQGRIFISYRRQETAWPARQLYEVLVARFGSGSVFKDVDDIDPGDDFVERITAAVASCDVLLALIGNRWVTMTDERGRRRLDDPDDFVRLEITAALSRGVRVVPILVDGAAMPRSDQLPPDLVPLTRRQAVEISPVGFNTERLFATLATALGSVAVAEPVAAAAPEPEPVAPAEPEPEPVAPAPPEPQTVAPVMPEPRPVAPAAPVAQEPVPTAPVVSEPVPAAIPTPQPQAAGPVAPVPPGPPPTAPTPPAPRSRRPLLVAAAAGVVVVLLAAGIFVLKPWAAASNTSPGGGLSPVASATGSASAQATGSSSATASEPPAGTPQILAHRGGLEVHQFETEQAMEAAAAAGFWVETDVRFTSDGVAVLVHDEKATKGLDCGGRSIRVSETTWADLDRYCRSKPTENDPTQYRVPRLEPTLEGIAGASGDVQVFLEVKTDQTDAERAAFLAAPARYGLRERTVITSARREWLDAIAAADPSYRRMLFVSGEQVPAEDLAGDGLWAVAVEQGVATQEYVDQLHAIGVQVVIWVLNDPGQWATFVPYGPDIVMTAYPERFKEWLAQR